MSRVLCHFNWLHCYRLIAVLIGFSAMGSLPFQLASLPQAHCRFDWLHCHGLIAISIGFNATGLLPFHWLHCLFWVNCLSNKDTATRRPICPSAPPSCSRSIIFDLMSLVIKPHLPLWHPICLFGTTSAFWRPTFAFMATHTPFLAPHLPYGAPFAFWPPFAFRHPHPIGSQKGTQPER
jgi:hypothetical protein